jgi:Ca2+-dependent lipid-binding protein
MESASNWKLRVMVKSVRHLPKTDAEGSNDVYAIVSMGKLQRNKTKVVPNTFDAVWREEFDFLVVTHDAPGEEEPDTISEDNVLTIDIMDHDRNSEAEYVGSVIINCRDLWAGSDTTKILEKCFPVRNMKDPETPEITGHDLKTTTVALNFTYLGILFVS